MRRFLMAAAMLAATGLVGCNQSERGGKTTDDTPGSSTFKVKAPTMSTTIKQGDRQTVKLTIARGKDFKEAVTLKAEPPAGVSVDLEPKKVKPSDGETVNATVSVDKGASLGDQVVKVTATPETGNATSVDFKVKVEKKDE